MIYNPTILRHPEEDGFPIWSGSSEAAVLFLRNTNKFEKPVDLI